MKNMMRHSVAMMGMVFLLAIPAVSLGGSVDAGNKVFDAKKCISCHSLGKEAGKMASLGGSLDGVGAKRDEAWLKKFLKDPKAVKKGAKMPKLALTDAELDDVVAYLLAQK